jgi:hypothetical protein
LRLRGFTPQHAIETHRRIRIEVRVNARRAGLWKIRRPGLFVLEADLPAAREYSIEILASPVWTAPPDSRLLSVNLSLLRLI